MEIKVNVSDCEFIEYVSTLITKGSNICVIYSSISDDIKKIIDRSFRAFYLDCKTIFSKKLADSKILDENVRCVLCIGEDECVFVSEYIANKFALPLYVFSSHFSTLHLSGECVLFDDIYKAFVGKIPCVYYAKKVDSEILFCEFFSKGTALLDYYITGILWQQDINYDLFRRLLKLFISTIKKLLDNFNLSSFNSILLNASVEFISFFPTLFGGEEGMSLFLLSLKNAPLKNIHQYLYLSSCKLCSFYYKILSRKIKYFIPPVNNNLHYEKIALSLDYFGLNSFIHLLSIYNDLPDDKVSLYYAYNNEILSTTKNIYKLYY